MKSFIETEIHSLPVPGRHELDSISASLSEVFMKSLRRFSDVTFNLMERKFNEIQKEVTDTKLKMQERKSKREDRDH